MQSIDPPLTPSRKSDIDRVFSKIAHSLNPRSDTPLYAQLVEQIQSSIQSHHLPPGTALPPQRLLTSLLNVSQITVRRSLQELAGLGLIETRRGSGSVVAWWESASRPSRSRLIAPSLFRLGIVLANIPDGYPFFSPMMQHINNAHQHHPSADATTTHLLQLDTGENDPDLIEHALPLDDLDGLIMTSPVNLELIAICRQRGLPYVLLYNDLADGHSHCVMADYAAGLFDAIAHLKKQGQRRLAMITADAHRFSAGQMVDAFRLGCRVHKIEVDENHIIAAGYNLDQTSHAVRSMIESTRRPDAMLFASDQQAMAGIAVLQQFGLQVPSDIAIVGIGCMNANQPWQPAISSIDLQWPLIGRHLVESLLEQITRPAAQPRRWVVPTKFIHTLTT